MSYAIVGFGAVGQALARAFARKNIDVTVASRRPPEALAPQARAIGPTVAAKSLRDALEADTIILAVPFEVAKALPSWQGKTVIDAMNALVSLEELDGISQTTRRRANRDEHADPPRAVALLRIRSERPSRGAASKGDELPPFHSITSSARSSIDWGTVRPSALAVLRLTTISIFVGN